MLVCRLDRGTSCALETRNSGIWCSLETGSFKVTAFQIPAGGASKRTSELNLNWMCQRLSFGLKLSSAYLLMSAVALGRHLIQRCPSNSLTDSGVGKLVRKMFEAGTVIAISQRAFAAESETKTRGSPQC
jgi:hypothetical protein